MKFKNINEFASLKYFGKNADNQLILQEGIFDEGIIDFHAHLGFNFLFGKPVDLECPCRVQHFFPEDNPINLENYSAFDYTRESAEKCRKEAIKQGFKNDGFTRTHTIPNILEEMDRMKVAKSVILAVDLAFASKNSAHILKHVKNRERLIPFVSLHPFSLNKRKKLEKFIKDGACGIKGHPPMQMVKPSNSLSLQICQLAREYKLPILYHTGHSPLSPEFQRKYVYMNDFEIAIRRFPDVTIIMGHSSIDKFREAAYLGKKYENVYLELSGQPPQAIKEIINIMGSEKLLFGTDWPFYPIAFPLVKVLMATEDNPVTRERILKTNAERLLKKYNCEKI